MTLTEKVRTLAKEATWERDAFDCKDDWFLAHKAACREYSGIIRGLHEAHLENGIAMNAGPMMLQAIWAWRETIRGETSPKETGNGST